MLRRTSVVGQLTKQHRLLSNKARLVHVFSTPSRKFHCTWNVLSNENSEQKPSQQKPEDSTSSANKIDSKKQSSATTPTNEPAKQETKFFNKLQKALHCLQKALHCGLHKMVYFGKRKKLKKVFLTSTAFMLSVLPLAQIEKYSFCNDQYLEIVFTWENLPLVLFLWMLVLIPKKHQNLIGYILAVLGVLLGLNYLQQTETRISSVQKYLEPFCSKKEPHNSLQYELSLRLLDRMTRERPKGENISSTLFDFFESYSNWLTVFHSSETKLDIHEDHDRKKLSLKKLEKTFLNYDDREKYMLKEVFFTIPPDKEEVFFNKLWKIYKRKYSDKLLLALVNREIVKKESIPLDKQLEDLKILVNREIMKNELIPLDKQEENQKQSTKTDQKKESEDPVTKSFSFWFFGKYIPMPASQKKDIMDRYKIELDNIAKDFKEIYFINLKSEKKKTNQK